MNRNHANFPSERSTFPAPLKSKKLQAREAAQWEAHYAEVERESAARTKAVEAFLASK